MQYKWDYRAYWSLTHQGSLLFGAVHGYPWRRCSTRASLAFDDFIVDWLIWQCVQHREALGWANLIQRCLGCWTYPIDIPSLDHLGSEFCAFNLWHMRLIRWTWSHGASVESLHIGKESICLRSITMTMIAVGQSQSSVVREGEAFVYVQCDISVVHQ